jgi:hypothetical protein
MKQDRITERYGRDDELAGLEDDDTIVDGPEERARKLAKVVLTALVAVPVTILLVLTLRPEGTPRVTRWPNGYTRTEISYREGRLGRVPHGPARAWHENGVLAEEGRYREGVPTGSWAFFDEAGREVSAPAEAERMLPPETRFSEPD